MKQTQQHRVQKMQLYYIAAKKCKNPTPEEAGARLNYGIQDIRLRPGKMQKRYQEQEQEEEPQQGKSAPERRTRLGQLQGTT